MIFTLREIEPSDAPSAAILSGQLGYPVETPEMLQRIAAIERRTRRVFVACAEHQVVGWIEVEITNHLASGARGEVTGLIVSDAYRSQRIGAKLLTAAENWAIEQGVTNIVVRSQVARENAHRFYLREGYLRTKTSAVFTKSIQQPQTK